MIVRRQALCLLGAAAGLAVLSPPAAGQQTAPPLLSAARARGIRLGAAMDFASDWGDAALLDLMRQQVDLVVMENGGKWKAIEPQPNSYHWQRFDRALAFAAGAGHALAWHTLLWQNGGMPEFLHRPLSARDVADRYRHPQGQLSAANAWAHLHGHLNRVAGRVGDRFWRIDVANEMFQWQEQPNELMDAHGFRRGMWWATLGGPEGPYWLDRVFVQARRRFPNARLILNDWGHEGAEGWLQRKRGYLLDWVTGAVARGCPIDGIGLQSHLIAGTAYDETGLADFCRKIADLGLRLHITELDVDETRLPKWWSRAQKDRAVADLAARHVRTVAASGALAELSFWHLRSDLNHLAHKYESTQLSPSPFSGASEPLPLYDALVTALTKTGP
ncbi:MAG: endo-1,4-beta-xylanase [Rhodothalassiaceae bacterium]